MFRMREYKDSTYTLKNGIYFALGGNFNTLMETLNINMA